MSDEPWTLERVKELGCPRGRLCQGCTSPEEADEAVEWLIAEVERLRAAQLDAFVAGFMITGEGYNGEYCDGNVSERNRDDLVAHVRERFEKWAEARRVLATGQRGGT